MWTRPSIPAATRTNAPNGTSLVTWPSMISPAEYLRSNSFQGSSWVALSESETRSRSRSTSSTSTSTSWPTVTTSLGWSTCFHESSDTCTSPSTPPRSTNAPKFTIEETVPLRRSPFCSDSRNFLRPSLCDSSRKARRESTTLLRLRSSSMILASSSVPTNGCRSRTRRRSTSDAGRNPRRPMSRIRPPLTTSMTGPLIVPPDCMTSSIRPQARSYCARFFDRIRRPSLSSFWRTRASIRSPTFTTSLGSTSWRIDSSLVGMTPSDL